MAAHRGAAVVDQGTILVIKKGGILSVPYGDASVVPTKYQDGVVHSPNTMVMKGLGFGMKKFGKEQTTRLMQAGEKVYPSKIAVNLPKDQVTISIIARSDVGPEHLSLKLMDESGTEIRSTLPPALTSAKR